MVGCGASSCGGEKRAERSLYYGRLIAAPMVRVSSLAFRVACAQRGADVVFSEEMIAAKLAKCVREEVVYKGIPNEMLPRGWGPIGSSLSPVADGDDNNGSGSATTLGSSAATTDLKVIEFVVYEDFKRKVKRSVVFATIARGQPGAPRYPEGAPLVAQIGAPSPELAAAATKVIRNDVDGVDVNMGCPKKFSVQNGMGAALMAEPARGGRILSAINEALRSSTSAASPFASDEPQDEATAKEQDRCARVSFKTRVFPDVADSVHQLKTVLETCNFCVHAITIHARTKEQRSETAPLTAHATEVVRTLKETCPEARKLAFVFNGSIASRQHINALSATATTATAGVNGNAGDVGTGIDASVFNGHMAARHAMWNPGMFWHTMNSRPAGSINSDSGADVGGEVVGSSSAHVDVADFTALPHGTGRTTQQQDDSCLAVYRQLLRVHLAYHTPFLYVKYHFTRSFQEFTPYLKKTVHPLLQHAGDYEATAVALGMNPEEAKEVFGGVTTAQYDSIMLDCAPDSWTAHLQELRTTPTTTSKRTERSSPTPAAATASTSDVAEPAKQRSRTD